MPARVVEEKSVELQVAEFFAGVGGFRLGLEAVPGAYKVVWSNQFEPKKRKQAASMVYKAHWPNETHLNRDIFQVLESEQDYATLREASPDVIVGGFPCQDYSVARPLSQTKGLGGEKGVLWWSLAETLRRSVEEGRPIKYAIFENVDRLLASPPKPNRPNLTERERRCRGRDFAMILSSLAQLGYAAEWRVITASEYGFPQKRSRTFIVAYHETTPLYARIKAAAEARAGEWMQSSVLADAFPATFPRPLDGHERALTIALEPYETQDHYLSRIDEKTWFQSSGVMVSGHVWTAKAVPAANIDYAAFTGHDRPQNLGDIVKETTGVTPEFYVVPEDVEKWRKAKGGERTLKTNPEGYEYWYCAGAMAFPDSLDRPARTVLTNEGGNPAIRTKHVIQDHDGRLRRLVPEELEAVQGFPRGHTDHADVTASERAFLMGNALVVGVVRRIGESLHKMHVRLADKDATFVVDRA